MVDDLLRRQANGEIADDLDPGFLQVALFGAALAPTVLASFAEDFTGLSPDSAAFVDGYREQLKRRQGQELPPDGEGRPQPRTR